MKFVSTVYMRLNKLLLLLLVIMPVLNDAAPGDPVSGWPQNTNQVIFSAPAIGPRGEIVVSTRNSDEYFPDGNVYSFNPDGTLRWVYPGTDWFESSPAIAPDGTVYVGGWDNNVYALNGQTGLEVWRYETGGLITAAPAIGPDGAIYIGSFDGYMYALNPDGQEKWPPYEVDEDLSAIHGGAVLNNSADTLYFGTEPGTLHAVDTATGATRWTYTVPPEHDLLVKPEERIIYSTPAIDSDGDIYFSCENGYLYMLSPAGELLNSYGVSDSILSSPVIDKDDRIYFSSRDTYFYCVQTDDTGVLDSVWEVEVGDVLYSTPAIDSLGNLIVAGYSWDTTNGDSTTIHSIDSDGSTNWNYTVNTLNDSSPNIAPDGSIYIGTHNGNLYKLEGSAPLANAGWPRQGSNRRETGWLPDLNRLELIDYFPDITHQFSNLSSVPWFGAGWISEVELPDINHIEHGKLYVAESGVDGVTYFDYSLQRWVFAFIAHPNYLYDLNSQQWLYHAKGTTVEDERWFYSFDSTGWIPESGL